MTPPFHPYLARLFEDAGGRPLAQVATVSPEGLPEVRTVVLRSLGADGTPTFASDARSGKFRALAARPQLELCLWHAPEGIQWRLRGRAAVHTGDRLATSTWRSLPPDTRALFFSPTPGRPLIDGRAEDPPLPEGNGGPPPTFAVVRLVPDRCERLTLGPPLTRTRWLLQDDRWSLQELVP